MAVATPTSLAQVAGRTTMLPGQHPWISRTGAAQTLKSSTIGKPVDSRTDSA
jgi:hypothetical protein